MVMVSTSLYLLHILFTPYKQSNPLANLGKTETYLILSTLKERKINGKLLLNSTRKMCNLDHFIS